MTLMSWRETERQALILPKAALRLTGNMATLLSLTHDLNVA